MYWEIGIDVYVTMYKIWASRVARGQVENPANIGNMGLIPGSGRSPGGGNGNSLQYFYLESSMKRGSWGDYSLWGHKEQDMTANSCIECILICTTSGLKYLQLFQNAYKTKYLTQKHLF